MLFKHSTQCSISANAYHEIERFLIAYPNAPLFIINVIEHRQVSNAIAAFTRIAHESPQVIILQHGIPVWHRSHHAISAVALEQAAVEFR